jgi:hypothetical protein
MNFIEFNKVVNCKAAFFLDRRNLHAADNVLFVFMPFWFIT